MQIKIATMNRDRAEIGVIGGEGAPFPIPDNAKPFNKCPYLFIKRGIEQEKGAAFHHAAVKVCLIRHSLINPPTMIRHQRAGTDNSIREIDKLASLLHPF